MEKLDRATMSILEGFANQFYYYEANAQMNEEKGDRDKTLYFYKHLFLTVREVCEQGLEKEFKQFLGRGELLK